MIKFLNLIFEKYLLFSFIVRSYLLPSKKRKCLLISHEATLSGAPVVLYNVAKILKNNGWVPVILSPYDGPLFREARRSNIIMYRCHWKNIACCAQYGAKHYDLIVINTAVNGYIVDRIQNCAKCPVLWWIHESAAVYSDACIRQLPVAVTSSIRILAGGAYAKRQIEHYRPNYEIQTLLYPSLDLKGIITERNDEKSRKINFYCIGTFEKRKAQDLLVMAIKRLPINILKDCIFSFIGRIGSKEIYNSAQSLVDLPHTQCVVLDSMPLDQLYQEYQKMDILVCPSRDDPMPVVIADALSLGKIVICSSNTGSAELLRINNAGFVFESDSVSDLVKAIDKAITLVQQKNKRLYYSARARHTYDNYFSEKAFLRNFYNIVKSCNLK